jgi:hypothetical protein
MDKLYSFNKKVAHVIKLLKKDNCVYLVHFGCVVDFHLYDGQVTYNVHELSKNVILRYIDMPTYEGDVEHVVYSVLNCLTY